MTPNTPLDNDAVNRIAAAVASEPSLLAALAQDPAGVVRTRFGVEVPAGFSMKIGQDRVDVLVPGLHYTIDMPAAIRDAAFGDELPDEMLDMAGGSGRPNCEVSKNNRING